MKRYRFLVNSKCIQCDAWLCVMAGTYTGEIACGKCGAANVFKDSSEPVEAAVSMADNDNTPVFVSSESYPFAEAYAAQRVAQAEQDHSRDYYPDYQRAVEELARVERERDELKTVVAVEMIAALRERVRELEQGLRTIQQIAGTLPATATSMYKISQGLESISSEAERLLKEAK